MNEINLALASKHTSPNPLTLVCTTKEDGSANLATVSWYTILSFRPNMMGFAMSQKSYSGEMVRKNKKVALAMPGSALQEAVKACGSTTGRNTDKVSEFNIEMQKLDGIDIDVPLHSKIVVSLTLKEYIEVGDHYFYICDVDKVYLNEQENALYAFNGYSKIDVVNS